MLNLKNAIKGTLQAVALRAGAIAGTWLVATFGIPGDLATQVGTGLTAGLLIGFDEVTRRWLKG